MESIARFMVAVAELLEAEGRVAKRAAVRVALAAGAALVALVLVLIGVAFATYGVFVLLAHLLNYSFWGAALIFAAIAFGGAVALLVVAKRFVVK